MSETTDDVQTDSAEDTTSDPIQEGIDKLNAAVVAESAGSAESQEIEESEAPESEAEAESKDTTPASETESTFTPQQLNAAERYGFTEDELVSQGDKGVALAEKLAEAHSKISARYSQIGQAEKKQRSQKPIPETGAAEEEASELKEVDPADFGEDSAKVINALIAQGNNFQGQLGALLKREEEADLVAAEREADVFFADLHKQGYSDFGDGPWRELDEHGPEATAREGLIAKADEIGMGHDVVQPSEPPMTREQAMKQALTLLHGNSEVKAKRAKTAKKVHDRAGQRIARANNVRSTSSGKTQEQITREAMGDWDKREAGGTFFTD